MCGAIQSTTPLDSYAAAGAKHVCRPYFQFQHSDQRKRRLQSDLEKLMQNVASSEHYVQIIDSFSKIYHEQKSGRESELGFLKELEDIVTKTSGDSSDPGYASIFSDLVAGQTLLDEHCFLRLNFTGRIIEANTRFQAEFMSGSEKSISDLGFEPLGHLDFKSIIAGMSSRRPDNSHSEFIQFYSGGANLPATACLIPSYSSYGSVQEILFVILNSSSMSTTAAAIAKNFSLSESELKIAEGFLSGKSLREVASQRNRSYKTVRNQFSEILSKTGCNSQEKFLRMAADIAFLLRADVASAKPKIPKRFQQFVIPRPGGRMVEVAVCGDLSGTPVLMLAGSLGHALSAEMVDILTAQEILYVSVLLPGFGKTSPVSGEEKKSVILKDVAAALDILEIPKCTLCARMDETRTLFNLLLAGSERFCGGVAVSIPSVQSSKISRNNVDRWTSFFAEAARNSRPVFKLLIFAATQMLLNSEDVESVLAKFFSSEPDRAYLQNPGAPEFLRNSIREAAIEPGFDHRFQHVYESLQPWNVDLNALKQKVLLIHGALDRNSQIENVRVFRERNPTRLQLVEFADAGSLASLSNFSEMIAKIKRYVPDKTTA